MNPNTKRKTNAAMNAIKNFFQFIISFVKVLVECARSEVLHRKIAGRCRSQIFARNDGFPTPSPLASLTARKPSFLETATQVRAKEQHPRPPLDFSPLKVCC